MRYIRTENGKIFDTKYEPKAFKYNCNVRFVIDDNTLIIYDTVFKDRIANHGKILKQADSIEELCDRYVHKEDVYFPKVVKGCLQTYDYEAIDYEITKEMIQEGIYGAIWTDKGLTYVAKMNEKGDLELI